MKPIFCFMGLLCLLRTGPVSLNAKARGHEGVRVREGRRREDTYLITNSLRLGVQSGLQCLFPMS